MPGQMWLHTCTNGLPHCCRELRKGQFWLLNYTEPKNRLEDLEDGELKLFTCKPPPLCVGEDEDGEELDEAGQRWMEDSSASFVETDQDGQMWLHNFSTRFPGCEHEQHGQLWLHKSYYPFA